MGRPGACRRLFQGRCQRWWHRAGPTHHDRHAFQLAQKCQLVFRARRQVAEIRQLLFEHVGQGGPLNAGDRQAHRPSRAR